MRYVLADKRNTGEGEIKLSIVLLRFFRLTKINTIVTSCQYLVYGLSLKIDSEKLNFVFM